jgi:hypothetical protein
LFQDEAGQFFSDNGAVNAFTCVQDSVSGPMAALFAWYEEDGFGMYEPASSPWHFKTKEEAKAFAIEWAEAEEIPFL